MSNVRPLSEALPILLERRDLPAELVRAAIEVLTSGNFDEAEAAAFLVALRMKGESAHEIAAAAKVLREKMIRIPTDGQPVLDTCGTGGDDSGTFNVSTASALVVAGTGARVVKHGNRSVSSKSGSADVLKALGVPIDAGPEWAARCLQRFGFAFCFAPHYHPALAHVAALRRKLGVRTLFNLLGPLLNPACADYQLLGVGRSELLEPLGGALANLGVRRAYLACSCDGLDEISLASTTQVREVCEGRIANLEWSPADFGLENAKLCELRAEGPEESAQIIRDLLAGKIGPARRIVLANAAAALLAAERVATLPEGVAAAADSIDSGRAAEKLELLRTSG